MVKQLRPALAMIVLIPAITVARFTRREFIGALADAGLSDIQIRETHRVHEHAAAAIVRARKPDGPPA